MGDKNYVYAIAKLIDDIINDAILAGKSEALKCLGQFTQTEGVTVSVLHRGISQKRAQILGHIETTATPPADAALADGVTDVGKYDECLRSLVRQVALMMDDCTEHENGEITIDCDISQGFLRRIYDLLDALEDAGCNLTEPPAFTATAAAAALRARGAVAVPEGFTLVENRALSQARMALAHATTTHGELYRDAYELLAASGRQDGAR